MHCCQKRGLDDVMSCKLDCPRKYQAFASVRTKYLKLMGGSRIVGHYYILYDLLWAGTESPGDIDVKDTSCVVFIKLVEFLGDFSLSSAVLH